MHREKYNDKEPFSILDEIKGSTREESVVSIQYDGAHLVLWVGRSFPANALPAIEQFLDRKSAPMHAYVERLTEGSYCNYKQSATEQTTRLTLTLALILTSLS